MEKINKAISLVREHERIAKGAAVVLIIIVALFIIPEKGENKESVESQSGEETAEEKTDGGESASGDEIYIDITGQVNNPGVYKVNIDSRLFQVIEKAGGLTEAADTDSFNRAEAVTDGEKIFIPARGESESQQDSGLVNINTADSSRLQTISGIGPAMADRIISYREDNGRFKKKEDLKNVSGIGEKTYEKLEQYITA